MEQFTFWTVRRDVYMHDGRELCLQCLCHLQDGDDDFNPAEATPPTHCTEVTCLKLDVALNLLQDADYWCMECLKNIGT